MKQTRKILLWIHVLFVHANFQWKIYSCPMKTHHSSDAHICGLSKAVQNCVIYKYYLGQMRCFRTKNNSSDSVNT